MGLSFLSLSKKLHIWMENILFLGS